MLVHDLTNRNSHGNLREWLFEILAKNGKDTYKMGSTTSTSYVHHLSHSSQHNTFDPEQFLGATQIPILVMGTKLDLMDEKRLPKKSGGIGKSNASLF